MMEKVLMVNHDQKITPDIVKQFPPTLKTAYEFYQENADLWGEDDDIDATIDLYFEKLNEWIGTHLKEAPKTKTKKTTKPKQPKAPKAKAKTAKKSSSKTEKQPKSTRTTGKPVSQLSPEIRVIRRAKNLHEKSLTQDRLYNFIKYLQRRIYNKEIRKTSEHAKTIQDIQSVAVHFARGMQKNTEVFKWPDPLFKRLANIANDEQVRTSVRLLNRYVGLINSSDMGKVKRLASAMENAVSKGRIPQDDPYAKQLDNSYQKLLSFLEKNKAVEASESELQGLRQVIRQMGLKPSRPKNRIARSGRSGKKKVLT